MKPWIKNAGLLASGLTVGGFVFNRYYRKKFSYVKLDESETAIEADKIMLPPIRWIQEAHYTVDMTDNVIPAIYKQLKQYTLISNGVEFKINHYTPRNSKPSATVLILHGFREFKEVYSEVIYYLLQLNFEVFIYDHRGHGEARVDMDSNIEIEDFGLYTDDAVNVTQHIVNKNKTTDHLIMLAHSMGGLIGLNLLEDQPHLFDGAVLNSPEFMLNSGELPPLFAYFLVEIVSQFDTKSELIFSEEILEDSRFNYLLKEVILSRSTIRRDFIYYLGIALYGNASQAGTIKWVSNSFKTMMDVVAPNELGKAKLPIMLIRSEEDDLINSAGIYTATHYLPNAKLYYVPGGRHENLLDKDSPLYALISLIYQNVQSMIN
ncbi:alpha/beta hydrolase [Aerococcaceae bacterium DSM 111176]|nr:alpha/beta hydrolase [Aerococcaceae bacterium DSM 111176]